jgi:bifunctional non-homologous end joining protein LigD
MLLSLYDYLVNLLYNTKSMKSISDNQKLVFVVQKHKATTLHYDFRLEIGGVMPSWAIPKGPTLDSSVKRLAVFTSDHPLSYRRFEGVLSKGEYGAGSVMVWDEGTYTPEIEREKGIWEEITERSAAEEAMHRGLQEGRLLFRLYGTKLRGSFALIRVRGFKGKESWLLIKHQDEYAVKGYDANTFDFSAISNRSLAEIAAKEEEADPH